MPREEKPTDRVQTNVLQMLIAVALVIGLMYYGTQSLAAQDALWFMRGFYDQPSRIVLYEAGQKTEWVPGRPQFDQIADGVVRSLDEGTVRGSATGLSEGSLQDAYQLYMTLEVFFDHPVKLHANVNTGYARQMLFPLTGRHSETNVVFLGNNGKYLSNGPLLRTIEPIRAALAELGHPVSD